eukprot:scaffold39309_cov61-Cyclotella_meneghiniana.AAC.1
MMIVQALTVWIVANVGSVASLGINSNAGGHRGLKHPESLDRSLETTCYPTARKIRLTSTTGEYLQLFEFVATDPSNADLAINKTATQSSTFGNNIVKYGPANAVDGDRISYTHTNKGRADPNPVWTVDLGTNHEVALIEIENRFCGDTSDTSNCLGRLSYAKVELLDSQDNVVDSKSFGDTTGDFTPLLNFNQCLSPTVSPTSSPSASLSASPTKNCYPTAKTIRLISTIGEFLQLFEFVATDPSNADLTTNKTATQSSTFQDSVVKYGPANAVDGDSVSYIHTNKGRADPNPVWT